MSTKTSARPKPKPITSPHKAAPKSEATETPRRVSGWVKAFVGFHLLAITIWAIPNPPAAFLNGAQWKLRTDSLPAFTQSLNDGFRVFTNNKLKTTVVKYYLIPSGFWQYWDMFAPNPANVDFYCDADVIYSDGTHRIYTYPRMYKLGLVQKYAMERFRKYYERARDDSYQYVWHDFAQRIALLSTTNIDNPPVEVRLSRHWNEVQPPGQPQSTTYQSYEYIRYSVNQTKLRHDYLEGD